MVYSVVVTHNGSKWIDQCFGSLINSTLPCKVIAIDNGSTDGTPELIRQKFPNVEIIEINQNLGFGKANNIGIKKAYEAGADYVFLQNQDAWVESDTLEKLVNVAGRYPDYGIVSPVHLNGDGNAFDYGFLNCLWASKVRTHLSDFYLKPKNKFAEIYSLDFINAALWLMPRKTIEVVGGFNPFFFHYGEDYDYVNRCHYFNLKVGFVPSARAYHGRTQHVSESMKEMLLRVPVLINLFDPQAILTLNAYMKDLGKSIVKNFLLFRFRQAMYFVNELAYFYSNRNTFFEISSKIKAPGLTYL
jgi:GT2 family glycosyltransferase